MNLCGVFHESQAHFSVRLKFRFANWLNPWYVAVKLISGVPLSKQIGNFISGLGLDRPRFRICGFNGIKISLDQTP
jgi:hypothetical protein